MAVMKRLLQSPEASIHYEAIALAPTFLSDKDLDLMLPFQEDPTAGETQGMGGPLRYVERDIALEAAERIAGRSFADGDCFELREGEKISWRSWSGFIQWLESRNRGLWQKLSRFFQ